MSIKQWYKGLSEPKKIAVQISAAVLCGILEAAVIILAFEYMLALILIIPGIIAFLAEALNNGANMN